MPLATVWAPNNLTRFRCLKLDAIRLSQESVSLDNQKEETHGELDQAGTRAPEKELAGWTLCNETNSGLQLPTVCLHEKRLTFPNSPRGTIRAHDAQTGSDTFSIYAKRSTEAGPQKTESEDHTRNKRAGGAEMETNKKGKEKKSKQETLRAGSAVQVVESSPLPHSSSR